MIHETKLTHILNPNIKLEYCELKPWAGPIKSFLSIPYLWGNLYIEHSSSYTATMNRIILELERQKSTTKRISDVATVLQNFTTLDIFKKQIKANTTDYDYQKIGKIH